MAGSEPAALSEVRRGGRLLLAPTMLDMTRCALCRTVIAPTRPKRIVGGESYHAGCWDRKVRQETRKPREN